jgi:FKBP-type peptidyl-prolyl cis-trans isomerase (trigger factor)
MSLDFTAHASKRLRQRGLRENDIEVIHQCATEVEEACFLLTKKDVRREVARLKQEIRTLERLEGCKLVMSGDQVVTAYKASSKNQKRSLQNAY